MVFTCGLCYSLNSNLKNLLNLNGYKEIISLVRQFRKQAVLSLTELLKKS